jgi:hypothetical protein
MKPRTRSGKSLAGGSKPPTLSKTGNISNDEVIETSIQQTTKFKSAKIGLEDEGCSMTASGSAGEQEVTAINDNDDVFPGPIHRSQQQQSRKVQFDALHQEMELVSYSISETGQTRRIIPRHLSIERTKKRRMLEKQDQIDNITLDDHDASFASSYRKIRGPKAAAEDHIVEASLVFDSQLKINNCSSDDDENVQEGDEDDDVDDDDEEISKLVDTEGIELDVFDDNEEENVIINNEEVEDEVEQVDEIEGLHKKSTSKRVATRYPSLKRKKTTPLQRLKNFKSMRMAEKHGAALGAHVQGKPAIAIHKLKQIAASAPSAPQIYSSLGMVYEDLLHESQRKNVIATSDDLHEVETSNMKHDSASLSLENGSTAQDVKNISSTASDNVHDANQIRIQDKVLREQINLAKKAYGSYHAAALLYKRDYSLWLRAADSAYEIANIHTTIIKLPDIANDILQYHRTEQKVWLEEAMKDYQTADNLNPPGIEIPAKLALVMIELGMLSEALTLLTCLKNQTEFDSSYRAWLLFADLMLRIGYECNRWNDGIFTFENKMFRRWLRKWSTTFDWQERRLQALVKSLEAACGSMCCYELVQWIRNRVDHANDLSCLKSNDDDDYTYPVFKSFTNEITASSEIEDHQSVATSTDKSTARYLPLVASCNTVFLISSELMRHMLDMQLYHGGKLVGDSISLYLKERQAMYDSRMKKKAEFDHSQQRPVSLFAMQVEPYDIGDDRDGSDSDNDGPISDDEDWGKNTVSRFLRKGTLPPELRFLYGLCLTGDGWNGSHAATCISSVRLLPLEPIGFFKDPVNDCSVVQDSGWLFFHETKTRPYSRLVALSYIIDVLKRCPREAEILRYISSFFSEQAVTLRDGGWEDLVQHMESSACAVLRHRQNHLIEVFIAVSQHELQQIESINDVNALRNFVSSRFGALTSLLSNMISVSWRVQSQGTIDTSCVGLIDTLSRLLQVYNDYICLVEDVHDVRQRETIVPQIIKIMSVLCGNDAIDVTDSINRQMVDLITVPIKSSWLTCDLESLATTVFNLCVGTNVSFFSGWSKEKFTAKSRYVISENNFYGVNIDEGPIAGYISEYIEDEVTKLWDRIQLLFSYKIPFNIRKKLQTFKNMDWYKENRSRYLSMEGDRQIVKYGEDRGLLLFVRFAQICLICGDTRIDSEKLRFAAFSILLPITQFLLKETIWDADIGNNVTIESSDIQEWLDVPIIIENENLVAPSNRPGYIRPSKRKLTIPTNEHGEKSLHEWFTWEDKHKPMSNLLKLSLPTILCMWRRCAGPMDIKGTLSAKKLMHDVHDSIVKLRKCYNIYAAERSSVVVAVNLLKLVSHPDCLNPFTVIQLAAMFASQGPKGGTSDYPFRAKLPRSEDCTASIALLTLGRAECLNSLYFCPEAAFLCNYVANSCCLHYNGNGSIQSSKNMWIVLSIQAYDLSVKIRITATSLLHNSDKREYASGVWADSVIEWFHHVRNMNLPKENDKSNLMNDSNSFDTNSLTRLYGSKYTEKTWATILAKTEVYCDVDDEAISSVVVEV